MFQGRKLEVSVELPQYQRVWVISRHATRPMHSLVHSGRRCTAPPALSAVVQGDPAAGSGNASTLPSASSRNHNNNTGGSLDTSNPARYTTLRLDFSTYRPFGICITSPLWNNNTDVTAKDTKFTCEFFWSLQAFTDTSPKIWLKHRFRANAKCLFILYSFKLIPQTISNNHILVVTLSVPIC